MEVNVQEDLNAVSDQITKLVEELNRVSAARENLMQQIQNLNGVGMYLRGKLPPEEQSVVEQTVSGDLEAEGFARDDQYPPNNA
jgi:hypothetical protein